MDDPRAAVHSLTRRNLSADKIVFGKPAKAAPAPIAKKMRPEEAFRATLLDCLAQITANAAALRPQDLRDTRSAEGLHQLRVAFRRLEVALGAFGKEFRQDWLDELRGRAKILLGRLSPARDLDVFVGKLLADPPKSGVRDGLPQLRARADSARNAAWAAVSQCITSADFDMFADDVAALASSQLPLSRNRRLPRTAERILDRQVKRVSRRAKVAKSREEGDMHRLRIALKKLRYTAEFFAPLYPRKKVTRYLKKLRGLQNHLGDVNDAANVRSVVGHLIKERSRKDSEGNMRYAAGAMVAWYGAQVPSAIKQALRRYKKFKRVKPYWR
ncbi:MAG TPA: CHAD domain-containing protein [Rhizomicrobium sp.]|nr:CHAD domain-containing protein [Rhizomicrobium sp.]